MKYLYVCELHFEEKFLNRSKQRVRLVNAKKPVPTVLPQSLQEKKSLLQTNTTPRKLPKQRVFRQDEISSTAYR